MAASRPAERSVLITGANGYIGQAVARAFHRAGFTTYGLVRSAHSVAALKEQSIVPIVGLAAEPEMIMSAVLSHTTTIDVLVGITADTTNYVQHFSETLNLLRKLAEASKDYGVRSLLLFTSGSKDYGTGPLDGSPGLLPHTEESPLRPPPFLIDRTRCATSVLDEKSFDAAVLRPTNVHGKSSSYLGLFFEMAIEAKSKGQPLCFRSNSRTIVHSVHVDDCAEAYVALATHPDRQEVAGQCFNISAGRRYETLRNIGDALAKAYDLEGVRYEPPQSESSYPDDLLTGWSQWIDSQKIRDLTGWGDKHPMFAEAIFKYKQEFEDAVEGKDENISKIKDSGVAKSMSIGR